MIRGLYTAATGMIYQRRRVDAISNNMANISTPGYKRDDVVGRTFKDELVLRIEKGNPGEVREVGPLNHGVYVEQMITSFIDGNLKKTDESTHMAIQGEGFFTILTEEGERYTRDGSFHINEDGILVTSEGYEVAGWDGEPIYIGNQSFEVDRKGNVIIDGNVVNQLQIVNFVDLSGLEKVGNNLFVNDLENEVVDFDGEVFQGYLEASNVDPTEEMADMIVAARSYESSQKIVQMMDQILGKAVNEVGKV